MSKYVYRMLSENAATAYYGSLKALEKELEIYCQLHDRKLIKQEATPTDHGANKQWAYTAVDAEGYYAEYPEHRDTPLYHSFYVERIELQG